MAQNLFDSTFQYGERQGDFSELLQIFSCKSFIGFCPNVSYKLWVVCIQIYIYITELSIVWHTFIKHRDIIQYILPYHSDWGYSDDIAKNQAKIWQFWIEYLFCQNILLLAAVAIQYSHKIRHDGLDCQMCSQSKILLY